MHTYTYHIDPYYWGCYYLSPSWLFPIHITCIWVIYYNNSLTWIVRPFWDDSPIKKPMIIVRSPWGRYNLPRCIHGTLRLWGHLLQSCLWRWREEWDDGPGDDQEMGSEEIAQEGQVGSDSLEWTWLVVAANPSEKWWSESQLGWWNSQCMEKNVPNHQPGLN